MNFSDADGIKTTIIPPGGYLIYAAHEKDVKSATTGLGIVDIWDATIGMNNTSPGQLILYDAPDGEGTEIDRVNQITGNWFAGKASPDYVSMERIDPELLGDNPENWQHNNQININGVDAGNNPILGTPKAPNSPSQGPVSS